jgi:8-oxo-dGTP diphosphatase
VVESIPLAGRTRLSSYVILTERDRILLCRISAEVPRAEGQWTLPGGGVEFGEPPISTARREAFEETGLRIEVGPVADVMSELFRFDPEPVHVIRIIYYGNVTGGELKHELSGSTDRAEWFALDQARALPLVKLARHALELAF